jgi:hypothetical protein
MPYVWENAGNRIDGMHVLWGFTYHVEGRI